MLSRPDTAEGRRIRALALTVFLLYLYYLFYQINFYLCNSLYASYYSFVVPVLVTGVLYFRRFRDGTEFKLLALYWLWYVLTRIVNRNLALSEDYFQLITLAPMLPMFVLGLVLDAEGRRRFLNWLCAVAGVYYFLLGLISLSAFVLDRLYINPITEGYLGLVPGTEPYLISILDANPNTSAYWFMSGLLMMVYQFFACRRKLWRVPIVLCALVCYATVAVTGCRSVRFALALSFGLLAALLAARSLKGRGKALRALLLCLLFLLVFAAADKSFALTTGGLSRLSVAVRADDAPAQSVLVDAAQQKANTPEEERDVVYPALSASPLYRKLNRLSTYRLEVYACALRSIREDPLILLRGCLSKDAMTVTNAILVSRGAPLPHFHNIFLQVLILTGLPGLALVLSFCFLLLRKGLRLFFSRDARIGMGSRALVLCIVAPLVYGLFEACLFTEADVRGMFFYLLSGMAMGEFYTAYPVTF